MSSPILSLDMHMQNPWETDIRILNALRDVLMSQNAWTLVHEGHWEEFTATHGIYYSPDGGYTFPASDDPEFPESAAQEMAGIIAEWEGELYDLGILAYPDGESGMYWIEYDPS